MTGTPTVVIVDDQDDGQDDADAAVAFAAGVATAEAGHAAEEAEEALEVAEQAQQTAEAAFSMAVDATANAGSCCVHCEDQRGELEELRERLAGLEDGALARAEEHFDEPPPERVEAAPAKPKTAKRAPSTAYGNDRWFGRRKG